MHIFFIDCLVQYIVHGVFFHSNTRVPVIIQTRYISYNLQAFVRYRLAGIFNMFLESTNNSQPSHKAQLTLVLDFCAKKKNILKNCT